MTPPPRRSDTPARPPLPSSAETGGTIEAGDVEPLHRWARRTRTAFGGAIALLGVWAVLLLVLPPAPWLETLAVPFAAPLVVVGMVMQFGRPCPRCGGRIRLGPRFGLPQRCPRCGIGLHRVR